MVNRSIEIVKNNNGVYLFHKEGTLKDKIDALLEILSTIQENPNYSINEKGWITEKAISDYRSLSTILENSMKWF